MPMRPPLGRKSREPHSELSLAAIFLVMTPTQAPITSPYSIPRLT
jgi:hypothetical protein